LNCQRPAAAGEEDHRLPFVEFRAVFQGGVLAETTDNNGVTQLTGKMLLKGTTRRSAEDIAREIESVGGSIDSYGGNNSFGVNAEVLSTDFSTGLDLVADVLLNPTFPAPAVERERQVQWLHPCAKDHCSTAPHNTPGLVRRARLWSRRPRHGGQRPKHQAADGRPSTSDWPCPTASWPSTAMSKPLKSERRR
jgi:hypothetical protein